MRPDLEVTLIERSMRKCRFLEQVAMHVQLDNIVVEQIDSKDYTTSKIFHAITARGVAKPSKVWEWTKGLLHDEGQLLLQTSEPFFDNLPGAKIRDSTKGHRGWVTAVARDQ